MVAAVKMLAYLMYYFQQECRLGRNVVRLEPESRKALADLIGAASGKTIVRNERPGGADPRVVADLASGFLDMKKNAVTNTSAAVAQLVQAKASSFLFEVKGASKEEKFEAIKKILSEKKKPAGLEKCRDTLVFPVGNLNSRLLFVGEAPGAEEEVQGEPFVGRAGELLTKMIGAMGLSRDDVFICNVLLRRPAVGAVGPGKQTGNRPPSPAEMAADREQLLTFIELVNPEVVVCLGLTAVKGLLALPDAAMSRLRGTWQKLEEPISVPVLPTYHPSYLLRNQAITEKRKVWEDLMLVMERLGIPISEKQRGYFTKS